MENIKWVDLQNRIKILFSNSKVRKYDDILEKDVNGWNWILSFDDLRTDTSLIIHTKFIFKLTDNKEFLRKNDFLYLKDLNCLYKIIRFDDLDEFEKSILKILKDNLFGNNLLELSKLLVEPEITINDYFFKQKMNNFSVFSFEYKPDNDIQPCQDLKLDFSFNINGSTDIIMKIIKEKKGKYNIIFTFGGKSWITELSELKDLVDLIYSFVKKNLR